MRLLQQPHLDDGQCDRHGLHPRPFRDAPCPKCEAEAEQAAAARELQRQVDRAIDRSGLEGRFLDATFDNYEATTDKQRKVLAECRRFADSFDTTGGGGLWLNGTVGTGKTHLASAMVRYVIETKRKRAAITSVRKLIAGRRALWDQRMSGCLSETDCEYVDRFSSIPLLVVDEVGADQTTEADRATLFDVLGVRYTLRKPTVLISNLTPRQVADVLGERLFDRMQEGAKYLPLAWPSYRRRRAAVEPTTGRPETTEGEL